MKKYNPDIHKRRSIRLKGYDYSREGLYFITICCQNREHYFGEIVDGKMQLNEIGEIAYNEWINTETIRKNVVLHSFVVMPNHFHTIVEIAHQCRGVLHTPNYITLRTPNGDEKGVFNTSNNEKGVCNTPLRSPSQTLGAIVRGYKSAVSKKIGFSVWQRNYYEYIIRNEESYFKIHEYIENNPAKWEEDCFY
ncbi:transposase [Capnocytophaga canis]|uniref:transposase n=1 Tax=Capnocytophaga canis TaxID=1848903 RepID=UPI00370D5841